MAKIPDLTIIAVDIAGQRHNVTVPCIVTGDGYFMATPERPVTEAIAARQRGLDGVPGVILTSYRGQLRVAAKTLAAVEAAVRQGILDHLNPNVTTTLVIRYRFHPQVSFWRDPDGAIHPNGSDEWADREGRWSPIGKGFHSSNRPNGLAINLYAEVRDRWDIKRGELVDIQYRYVDSDAIGFHGRRLNGFVVAAPHDPKWERAHTLTDIPYTEPAAAFFADAMLGICALAERLHDYLGSPEAVAVAIEGGASLMVAGPRGVIP